MAGLQPYLQKCKVSTYLRALPLGLTPTALLWHKLLVCPDELTKIAETKQGRRKLKSQATAMVTDTLDKLEELLRPLPPEMIQKILTEVEAQLQQFNPGTDPKYMKEALERLKARLN